MQKKIYIRGISGHGVDEFIKINTIGKCQAMLIIL